MNDQGETWGEAMARALQEAVETLSQMAATVEAQVAAGGYTLPQFQELANRTSELITQDVPENKAFIIALTESNRNRIAHDER